MTTRQNMVRLGAAPLYRSVPWAGTGFVGATALCLIELGALLYGLWLLSALAGESLTRFLTPWEFSPTVLLVTLASLGCYLCGLRRAHVPLWRSGVYYLGVLSLYFMLQTQIDYYSQHMFFIHRAQHLVLHHLGPFLVALAAPQEVLIAGLPRGVRRRILLPVMHNRVVCAVLDFVQHPVIAPVLFIGLLYFWLIPGIHFDAMLSFGLYKLMNWSMVVDGLLFWWLMLDPHAAPPARLSYGARLLMLWAIMLPQIVLGAYLSLTTVDVYPVYQLCGRAFAIDPMVDQHIGGLIIWIPASMMSVIAAVIVLYRWRNGTRPTPCPDAACPSSKSN